jgi:hypothetical protein
MDSRGSVTERYTYRVTEEGIVLSREDVQNIIRAIGAIEHQLKLARTETMLGYGIAMNLAIIRMTLNPKLVSSPN